MTKTRPPRSREPSAWRSAPTRAGAGFSAVRLGDRPAARPLHPPGRAVRGGPQSLRRGRAPWRQALGGELRTPYLHQLPPVLPRNSFFSEFQMNFFQPPSSLAFPRAMVAGQRLPRGCGETAACARGPLPLPLGAGRDLRRLHPPLPLRRSECQTRRGGAGAGARGGRRRGRGRREGWAAPNPAPIGGHAAAHGLSLVQHPLLLPLELGGSWSPQLPLLRPLGTRTGPPPPVTSAEMAEAGESQREGRTNGRRTARQRRHEPSNWRRAHALPLLYTAPRRRGAPPTSGQAGQSPARRGGAPGPRGRAWGRHKGAAVARGVGRRAGARGGAAGSEQAAARSPLLAAAQRPPAPPSCGVLHLRRPAPRRLPGTGPAVLI